MIVDVDSDNADDDDHNWRVLPLLVERGRWILMIMVDDDDDDHNC